MLRVIGGRKLYVAILALILAGVIGMRLYASLKSTPPNYVEILREYKQDQVFRMSDVFKKDWDFMYGWSSYGDSDAISADYGIDMSGFPVSINTEYISCIILVKDGRCIETYSFPVFGDSIYFYPTKFCISRDNDKVLCEGPNETGDIVFRAVVSLNPYQTRE